jgi:hypothetical protein
MRSHLRCPPLARFTASLVLAAVAGCSSAGTPAPAPEATDRQSQDLYGLGTIAQVWPNGVVPVCFQNTSDHPALQVEIRTILANSWSKAANITFTGFGACAANTNQVTVVFSTIPGVRGHTSFLGLGQPTVTLVADDTSPTESYFTYEVLHEFGHVLGFTHEQQRPDNWIGGVAQQCGAAPTDPDFGDYAPAPGGLNLTHNYDPNSIMNYCDANPTQLSVGDILASSSASAYGPSSCVFSLPACASPYSAQWATYTVPSGCPATTGWVLEQVINGVTTAVPNFCIDGSTPGTCTLNMQDPNTFVIGTQSPVSLGATPTLEMCDIWGNCSPTFQSPVVTCDELYLNIHDTPLQVTQRSNSTANVIMDGPWIRNDLGLSATGQVLSSTPNPASRLLVGATFTVSQGYTINSNGVLHLTVNAPASAAPGPYSAVLQATDQASQITHQTIIPIEVLACVPETASQVCPAGGRWCGAHSAGCGVTVDCGSCPSGSSCTSGVCCPAGTTYSATLNECAPISCPAGTSLCASSGSCLTDAQCAALLGNDGCTPAMAKKHQCM